MTKWFDCSSVETRSESLKREILRWEPFPYSEWQKAQEARRVILQYWGDPIRPYSIMTPKMARDFYHHFGEEWDPIWIDSCTFERCLYKLNAIDDAVIKKGASLPDRKVAYLAIMDETPLNERRFPPVPLRYTEVCASNYV